MQRESNTTILRLIAAIIFAVIVISGSAFADSSFDFSTDGTINANSVTFNGASGASITLYGFSQTGSPSSPGDLWYKDNVSANTGIGLKHDPFGNHEIAGSSFVQFTDAGISSITVGSLQRGDSYALYGSNTLGELGTFLIASGNKNDATVSGLEALDGGYKYLSLIDPGKGNILLASATYSTPEPGTLALFMTLGCVGLFFLIKHKLTARV